MIMQKEAPNIADEDDGEVKAVPLRRPGRWIAGVALVALVALAVRSIATNSRFQWGIVGHYLFDDRVLSGLLVSIELTALAMILAIVLGVVLAIMRMSANPVSRALSWVYIWVFRGIPMLVQILFWSFVGALYPLFYLGIPFGPSFFSVSANKAIPSIVAALLGLGLAEAAYMAEIVRAGFESVDEGQVEAGQCIGLRSWQILAYITLPQAMRVMIPPTGNEIIGMLKNTSLVSVIAATDLLYSVKNIYAVNYDVIPLLIVACIWYLACTSVLYVAQAAIERRLKRGDRVNGGGRVTRAAS